MRIDEIENKDKTTKFEALHYGAVFRLWPNEENVDTYIKLDANCVINLSSGMLFNGKDECDSFIDADVVRMQLDKHHPRLFNNQFCNVNAGEVFIYKDVRYMKTSDSSVLYNVDTKQVDCNFLADVSEVLLIPDYKIEVYEA